MTTHPGASHSNWAHEILPGSVFEKIRIRIGVTMAAARRSGPTHLRGCAAAGCEDDGCEVDSDRGVESVMVLSKRLGTVQLVPQA